MTCSSIRICSENAADTATITATGAASGAGPKWLQTEPRGEFLRILDSTTTILATLPRGRSIGCVALPASNLSASARWRVRLLHETAGQVADSGWRHAAPGPLVRNWHVRMPVNVNAYGDVHSGNEFAFAATCCAIWFLENSYCHRVVIDIEDPRREHLDIARLVIGPYIAPRYGASYGARIGMQDQTSNTDTAGGDVRTSRGPRRRTLGFSLDWIDAGDRAMVLPVIREGIGRRHFISLLPDNEEPTIVQTHQLWGVLRNAPDMTWQYPTGHAAAFELKEG